MAGLGWLEFSSTGWLEFSSTGWLEFSSTGWLAQAGFRSLKNFYFTPGIWIVLNFYSVMFNSCCSTMFIISFVYTLLCRLRLDLHAAWKNLSTHKWTVSIIKNTVKFLFRTVILFLWLYWNVLYVCLFSLLYIYIQANINWLNFGQ